MTDDVRLDQLLARIASLETRAARAEERASRLEEEVARGTSRGSEASVPHPPIHPDAPDQPNRSSTRARFLTTLGIGAAGLAAAEAVALIRPGASPTDQTGMSGLPVYNVRTYGATGTGATDDTEAINAAIAAAARAGGGVVYVPAGTYRVTPRPHPLDAEYAVCVLMRRGVLLRGAGAGAATIRLASNASLPPGGARVYLLLNAGINPGAAASTPDEHMTVEDIAFDGNARDQTALTHGVVWIRCRDVHHTRVRVANVHGAAASGPAETFCFEFQLGAEAFYTGCEAVATDGGHSATGFSADGATGLTYVACVGSGMAIGQGFTHYGCALVRYVNCHTYGNGGYGFNSELSEDVRYANCVAGGRADGVGAGPFAPHQSLGNAGPGFFVRGSRVVDLLGCSSRANGSDGLWIAHHADSVRVSGGEYSANAGWGIAAEAGSTNIAISHETRLADNTAGALRAQADVNAASPFFYDSGWVAAGADTTIVAHGFPHRPRFVTVYGGTPTIPDDTTAVPIHPGAVFADNTRVWARDVTAGLYYRFFAMF